MTLTVDGLLLAYHRFRSLYFTALVWEVWRNSRALFLLVTLFPYLQGHICTRYCEASHNGTLNSSVRSTAKCWYSSYCKRRNWWMWRVAFWYPLAINCHHFLMWTGNTPLSLADICSQNGISLADILLAISCHFTCWYRLAISRYHLLIYLFSKWHNSCWYLAGNKLSFHLLISTGNKPLSLADIFLFSKWHITCWYLTGNKLSYHLLISTGNKLSYHLLIYIYIYICVCVCVCVCVWSQTDMSLSDTLLPLQRQCAMCSIYPFHIVHLDSSFEVIPLCACFKLFSRSSPCHSLDGSHGGDSGSVPGGLLWDSC